MSSPVFIQNRGLAGFGSTDTFVPGQSYVGIIGSGYAPVPQPNDSMVPLVARSQMTDVVLAPPASRMPFYLAAAALAALALWKFAR